MIVGPAGPAGINIEQWYLRPPHTSLDAYRIWNECNLPERANTYDILIAMDRWVRNNCTLTIVDNSYYQIEWRSPTGTKFKAPVETFGKWMLCACVPIEAPQPIPIETSVQEPISVQTPIEEPLKKELSLDDLAKIVSSEEEPQPIFDDLNIDNLDDFLKVGYNE